MKATLKDRFLLVERTDTDKPIVKEPYPRPAKVTPAEYSSWRKDYPIMFDTSTEAEKAYAKVVSLNDFDKAAAWLDKQ